MHFEVRHLKSHLAISQYESPSQRTRFGAAGDLVSDHRTAARDAPRLRRAASQEVRSQSLMMCEPSTIENCRSTWKTIRGDPREVTCCRSSFLLQCRTDSLGVHCQPQGVNRRTTAGPDILFEHFIVREEPTGAEVDSRSGILRTPVRVKSAC